MPYKKLLSEGGYMLAKKSRPVIKKAIKKLKESDLWNMHYKELVKTYGKKRAETANVGWVTEEGSIASKIYGSKTRPQSTFSSFLDRKRNKIFHEVEEEDIL